MYFEQLVYITEAYKLGTLSKAANKCHISIPGISQSITSLEDELGGMKIFKRSHKGVTPTTEGIKIIKKAYEVIAKLEELKEISKPQNMVISGELNISASPSLIIILLKSAYSFKKDYPNVKIDITEKTAREIVQSAAQNKIDIGFAVINRNLFNNPEEWDYEALLEGKRYVCVSKNSPYASNVSIEPYELLNQQLVIYNGINQKLFINAFFKKYGEMKILFESNQYEIIKKTISEGLAVGFLNSILLQNDPYVLSGDIILLTIKEFEKMDSPFGWLRLRNTYFSPTAKKFLKYVKIEIKQGYY